MFKAYRFRMYPNEERKILIEKHIGSCRYVWNHFLDLRNRRYAETKAEMNHHEMSSLLPALKDEHIWLTEINSQSIQHVLIPLFTDSSRKRGTMGHSSYLNIARIHEHIANQRKDFHEKVSDILLKAYDTIIGEDLNVSDMMKNHHLAKREECNRNRKV